MAVSRHVSSLRKKNGLVPIFINARTGNFRSSSTITLGARGDSYYEYLLKTWLQTGKTHELWVFLLTTVCLSVCLCLYVCSSDSLSIIVCVCWSVCLCVCLCLSICLSLSVCLFLWSFLSVCLCLFVCLSDSLSIIVCVCWSVCLSVCLSVSLCPFVCMFVRLCLSVLSLYQSCSMHGRFIFILVFSHSWYQYQYCSSSADDIYSVQWCLYCSVSGLVVLLSDKFNLNIVDTSWLVAIIYGFMLCWDVTIVRESLYARDLTQ